MATIYYIGTRPHVNGRFFIHKQGCPLLPSPGKRIKLGTFLSPEKAAYAGNKYSDNPATCRFCIHHAESERSEPAVIGEAPELITRGGIKKSWESPFFCGVN